MAASQTDSPLSQRRAWNGFFWSAVAAPGILLAIFIVSMLWADFRMLTRDDVHELLSDHRVQYSIRLSLLSSTISALFAVIIAVPTGYWLARWDRRSSATRGRNPPGNAIRHGLRFAIEAILDVPIVLPPIVVGISLLILFQTEWGTVIDRAVGNSLAALGFRNVEGITYEIPAVILAQFAVVSALAIRMMRQTFEMIGERPESIARTLGASDYQAFSQVTFPQSLGGCASAFTLAWARALGEFGPVLIFAGTTRMKTEVLPTTVYLNFQSGNLRGAVTASAILVLLSLIVLIILRWLSWWKVPHAGGIR